VIFRWLRRSKPRRPSGTSTSGAAPIASDSAPSKTVYLDAVTPQGKDEPERIMLFHRNANKVYVRAVDPCDNQEPERVPFHEGDELIVMEHLAYVTLHLTPEGSEGYLLPQRIVPVRREQEGVPSHVIARTLRYGEHDDGSRVHVAPGDTLELHPTVELDAVDEFESEGVGGYAPLTPVLFTWLALSPQHSEEGRRYLLSAARRLDLAQRLFTRVEELRQDNPEGAPATRRVWFELIAATELGVVSLSRAMDMCMNMSAKFGVTNPVPSAITSRSGVVTAIRNAYEHIEDRALGNVRGRPHDDALTIFDHASVVADGVITYGSYRLDLASDIPDILSAVRQFLKSVAGDALPAPPQASQSIAVASTSTGHTSTEQQPTGQPRHE
jgi:hypothetical protein